MHVPMKQRITSDRCRLSEGHCQRARNTNQDKDVFFFKVSMTLF